MMKKWIGILLASALCAAMFTGCSSNNNGSTASQNGSSASQGGSTASQGSTETKKSDNFNAATPITVVSREDGSGTRGAFIELFGVEVKGEDGTKTDQTTKEATISNSTEVVISSVVQDPYAIGYISLGSMNSTVKALKVDGNEASAENVKSGSYKIARPFNIATKGEPTGLTKDFIDFILSKEGQEVVGGSYISIKDDAVSFAGSKPAGKLVIAGSSSVSPIMEKLSEAYKKINTGATIEIQQSDSTAGMTAVNDGTCDIGMASRELKETELAALTPVQIALDGIAVVVNPANPLNEITSEQVKSIYTGNTLSWDQIA